MSENLNIIERLFVTAEKEFAVPFVGFATPEVWGEIVSSVMDSDRGGVNRLLPNGETETLSTMFEALSNPDNMVHVEVAYMPGTDDGETSADIRQFYDKFDRVAFREEGGSLFVNVIAKKREIMSVIDWTSARFTGIRMGTITEEAI